MDTTAAAQLALGVGAVLYLGAGGGHLVGTLRDVVTPTMFTPTDDTLRERMSTTGVRFRGLFGDRDAERWTMWSAWLGFHLSHGLGAFAFGGLVLLLVALHGAAALHPALLAFVVGVSAAYLAIAVRFWFWVPATAIGVASGCLTLGAALALVA